MQQSYNTKKTTGRAMMVIIILLVPILAALNAIIGPYSALPYVAGAASILIFALPIDGLVLLCLLTAAVFAGVLEYFGHISQGFWLPYLMGLLFIFRAVAEKFRSRNYSQSTSANKSVMAFPHGIVIFSILYLAISIFGTAIALPPFSQVFIGIKNYFFLWGLPLLLLWRKPDFKLSKYFWNCVLIITMLQWPVVLYQRIVVVAKRHDAAAWDAIVGTYGGQPDAGGHSAAMAMMSCITLGLIFWRFKEKTWQPNKVAVFAIFALIPIAMAEVKAAFIWLAVVFFIFSAKQILREPLKAILILLSGAGLLVSIAMIYKVTMYDSEGDSSWTDIYDKQIKYGVDPNEFNPLYRRLGRIAALTYWSGKHSLSSAPVETLIGHGLGSSRSSSSLGMGEMARKLNIEIDTTATSTLLWDTGLLGAITFTLVLISGALTAYRQSGDQSLPASAREASFAATIALALNIIGTIYNRDSIDTPSIQIVILFSLTHVILVKNNFTQSSKKLFSSKYKSDFIIA